MFRCGKANAHKINLIKRILYAVPIRLLFYIEMQHVQCCVVVVILIIRSFKKSERIERVNMNIKIKALPAFIILINVKLWGSNAKGCYNMANVKGAYLINFDLKPHRCMMWHVQSNYVCVWKYSCFKAEMITK